MNVLNCAPICLTVHFTWALSGKRHHIRNGFYEGKLTIPMRSWDLYCGALVNKTLTRYNWAVKGKSGIGSNNKKITSQGEKYVLHSVLECLDAPSVLAGESTICIASSLGPSAFGTLRYFSSRPFSLRPMWR